MPHFCRRARCPAPVAVSQPRSSVTNLKRLPVYGPERTEAQICCPSGTYALGLLLAAFSRSLLRVSLERDEHHSAVRLFTLRYRRHAFDGIDGIVDYLPVCRRHGFESTPRVAGSNFGCYLLNEPGERLLPALSVPIDVNDDPAFGRADAVLQNSACQLLQGKQRRPFGPDQRAEVVAVDQELYHAIGEVLGADSRGRPELDQEPLQELLR